MSRALFSVSLGPLVVGLLTMFAATPWYFGAAQATVGAILLTAAIWTRRT